MDIGELGLSVRAYNALRRDGIHSTEDLIKKIESYGERYLTSLRWIGPVGKNEIINALEGKGYKWNTTR